ncbi:protein tyrosine phosphatase domain-containing protein 1-like [Vanessa cardui]|uniref:protein tyrosine phosphatase domain-containing protein 1-like n=1 Tax=Vanessa cardui TaxID=171605 RepID=UPI001F12A02F|nr:protein tyrosine phosphatase domain-containing protein 1-like [Vanessa cardui]
MNGTTSDTETGDQTSCHLWERLGCARAARFFRRRLRRVAPEGNGKTGSRESRRRVGPPKAIYSGFSERVRTKTPAALQCALFCGGARCQYELPRQSRTAIQGVYSDWVTEDILAMARPSTASIAARNIIQQFHCWGIRTVINLQIPGEHSSCGPPLTKSGFTYDPNIFMANDIYYYNFAWPDYGEASLSGLLDMAKVISFALQEGRVAIHCHAGLGRTGVLIACYLVYSLRIRANDAIRLVRKKRPRSVQMSGQIQCVQQFEHYLLPQTVVFSSKEALMLTRDRKTSEFTLRQYLYRQRAVLHGVEERAFKLLPKIVYCICERLLKLCGCHQSGGLDLRIRNRPFYTTFYVYKLKQIPRTDPQSPDEIIPNHVTTLPMVEWRDPIEEDIDRNLESVSRITGSMNGGSIPALHVHEAFITDHKSLPDDKQKYLKQFRTEINQRRDAINKIEKEDDPLVLTGLLFEWLEGLKEPVLDREDLSTIIGRCKHVNSCVDALEMEDVMLIEYLLRFVIRLRPLAAHKKVDIIKRLIAALTHQTVQINGKTLPDNGFPKLRDGTCSQIINFMLRLVVEIQKDIIKPGRDETDVVIPPRRLKIKAWK